MPNDTQFKTVSINTTNQQEEKMLSFLLSQCGKSYDYNAALAYWIPWRGSMPEYSKYFCSQLMLTSLHQIQMFLKISLEKAVLTKAFFLIFQYMEILLIIHGDH